MPAPVSLRPRQDDWARWLDAIEHDGVNLTAWEEDFIESVGDQVKRGRSVSEKQREIIERIYIDRVPLMILIDRRVGSSDLYPLLRARGVAAELTTLAFGDAALLGQGPQGNAVTIGVERKRLSDLLSSLTSGRLAGHQLPGLLTDYTYVWLVVEGRWEVDESGVIQTWQRAKGARKGRLEPLTLGRRRFLGRDLESYLLTLELRGGVRIRRTGDAEETAEFLTGLHQWWTGKTWAEHRSHLALYDHVHESADATLLVAPTLVRKWAAALPGVGYEKSAAVSQRFKTGLEMALADEVEWRKIAGIGKTLSTRIVKGIREGAR